FYTVFGDDEDRKAAAAGLESAKGVLRSAVQGPRLFCMPEKQRRPEYLRSALFFVSAAGGWWSLSRRAGRVWCGGAGGLAYTGPVCGLREASPAGVTVLRG
ncbi:hypothetical protein ABZ598_06985, partial [Streptomyces albus]